MTCWDGAPPNEIREIIEIGAYKLDRYGETLGKFKAFVRPTVNPVLSNYCKSLTGIQQHDLDAASTFDQVIEEFIWWTDVDNNAVHFFSWGSFDYEVLKHNCLLHNIESEWLENYTDLKAEYKHIRTLSRKVGLKSALSNEGFEFEGDHHRALDDTFNLLKIFKRYIDEWSV